MKVKDKDLFEYFKEVLYEDELNNNTISEALTQSDKNEIKTIVKSQIKDFLNLNRNSDFEKKVGDIVAKKFKNDKDVEKRILEITRNVIIQLYKTLWTKRNFWSNDLKNLAN